MRCGCEYGGDCTSISVCTAEAMVEDAVEELHSRIEELEADNKRIREERLAFATESEQRQSRIEELEAKVKRLTSRGFEDLHHENAELLSRIEAGLRLADEMAKKSGDGGGMWSPSYRLGYQDASKKLREALGGSDD